MAKFPNSISDWDTWTGWAHWEVAHNFTDAAGSPVACAEVSGSAAFGLSRLGSTDPDLLSTPQARFDDQGGIKVRSAPELLYRGSDANWSVHMSQPTVYAVVFKLETDASGAAQDIFCGQDGTGGGWTIQVDANNNLRLRMMAATSINATSSGVAADGRWHLALVVIDDANNRGKIVTEWGSATITATAYSESGSLICTIGPTYTGATFPKVVSYAATAKGKHSSGWDEASNILASFIETYNRNAESGFGGADEPDDIEATGTLASVSESAVDAFDSEWDYDTYFAGGHTNDSATHTGEYDASVAAVSFGGGFTCASATHRGAFGCSKFVRVFHKQAALARVVWFLRGSYDAKQCDLTGAHTSDDATHGGTYG